MGFGITEILMLFVMLPIFVLPTIIAVKKDHEYKVAIIVINIIGGFFWGIGWLVALVWCFIEPNKNDSKTNNSASDIEKLHELMKKGVISEDEFESKKKAFLET